jgi:hypothetical protein
MARRVLKKLERVISTKILKADFPQIMEEAKDLHSKKIISQPSISAFLRFAISLPTVGTSSSQVRGRNPSVA